MTHPREIPSDRRSAPKWSAQVHGGCRSGRTKDVVAELLRRECTGLADVFGAGRAGGWDVRLFVRPPLRRRRKRAALRRGRVATSQQGPVRVRRGGCGGRTGAGGVRGAGTEATVAVMARVPGLHETNLLHEHGHGSALNQQSTGEQKRQQTPPSGGMQGGQPSSHRRRDLINFRRFQCRPGSTDRPSTSKPREGTWKRDSTSSVDTRRIQKHSPNTLRLGRYEKLSRRRRRPPQQLARSPWTDDRS